MTEGIACQGAADVGLVVLNFTGRWRNYEGRTDEQIKDIKSLAFLRLHKKRLDFCLLLILRPIVLRWLEYEVTTCSFLAVGYPI